VARMAESAADTANPVSSLGLVPAPSGYEPAFLTQSKSGDNILDKAEAFRYY
jgi:hypothetical protein